MIWCIFGIFLIANDLVRMWILLNQIYFIINIIIIKSVFTIIIRFSINCVFVCLMFKIDSIRIIIYDSFVHVWSQYHKNASNRGWLPDEATRLDSKFFDKSLYWRIIIETSIVEIEFVYCLPTSTRSFIHYFSLVFSEVSWFRQSIIS